MHLPGFILLAVLSLLTACGEKPANYYQGYAEGEFVQVAAPIGGRLERLVVRRGETVRAGELLFSLEQVAESAAVAEAQQNLEQAENLLADLLKGERPSELAALAARLEQARVARDLSRSELERRHNLYEANVLSAEERDRARTAFRRDESAVADLEAQLRTARLGARSDRIEAARAETKAARARLEQARWALAQKSQNAEVDAFVFDTLFEVGEFVPASLPVVTLLPPGQVKLRFFVPEPAVGALRIGQQVAVTFDGSGGAIDAAIVFISPRAEFTPPLIYSRETRAKLVFLVEARPAPADASRLHPGQPVEVRMEATP
jgi:HlyD family secretion protein